MILVHCILELNANKQENLNKNMAKHIIQFSDGSEFEITDEELTKPIGNGIIIPYDEIEKSLKQ